jgi:hypothetical protein
VASTQPYGSDEDTATLLRAVHFPVELITPNGFRPGSRGHLAAGLGRLEWVGGKLLFMPPCGDSQQYTVADLVICLGARLTLIIA